MQIVEDNIPGKMYSERSLFIGRELRWTYVRFIDDNEMSYRVSYISAVLYYVWLPLKLVHHSYSAIYDCNTDNSDTRPVQRNGSQECQEPECIWQELARETCLGKMEMATALGGQLSVKQAIRKKKLHSPLQWISRQPQWAQNERVYSHCICVLLQYFKNTLKELSGYTQKCTRLHLTCRKIVHQSFSRFAQFRLDESSTWFSTTILQNSP